VPSRWPREELVASFYTCPLRHVGLAHASQWAPHAREGVLPATRPDGGAPRGAQGREVTNSYRRVGSAREAVRSHGEHALRVRRHRPACYHVPARSCRRHRSCRGRTPRRRGRRGWAPGCHPRCISAWSRREAPASVRALPRWTPPVLGLHACLRSFQFLLFSYNPLSYALPYGQVPTSYSRPFMCTNPGPSFLCTKIKRLSFSQVRAAHFRARPSYAVCG